MKHIKSDKLKQIHGGGGSGLAIGLLITAGIILIVGIIDGYFRPLKCNK